MDDEQQQKQEQLCLMIEKGRKEGGTTTTTTTDKDAGDAGQCCSFLEWKYSSFLTLLATKANMSVPYSIIINCNMFSQFLHAYFNKSQNENGIFGFY